MSSRKFTLVEVMVAMLVTSIIIGGSVSLINVLQWGVALSQRTSRGTEIAGNRIEQLHTGDFANLHLREEVDIRVNDQGVPSSDGLFLRSTTINQNSDAHAEVIVTVTAPWRGKAEKIKAQLTTVLINPELLQEDF